MQFVYFCMLLSAFFGILLDDVLARSATEFCLSWCLGLVVCLGIVGKFAASQARFRMKAGDQVRSSLNAFERQRHYLLWLWIATAPWYMAAIGWGSFSRSLVPGLDSLAWTFACSCFPSILVMTLLDTARHQLIRACTDGSTWGARHGWLVTIVPCLATCLVWDAARSLEGWLAVTNVTASLFMALCFSWLWLTCGLPLLLLRVWSTDRLAIDARAEPALRAWVGVGGLAAAVRLWRTDSTIASAMVIGFYRRSRFLLLSDLLVERLDPDELKMIVLHEAAHCRRWHVWIRMLPVLGLMLPALLLQNEDVVWLTGGGKPWWISIAAAGIGLLSIVATCRLLSWIARWTELDADRTAVILASDFAAGRLEAFVEGGAERSQVARQMAARVLIRALEKLTPLSHVRRASWLHPSLECRIQSLDRQYFNGTSQRVESLVDIGCFSSPH